MAVDLGDHSSGFRHSEVIRFINNEILMNGGGPEFYSAFRMRPWNEIEDQLCAILIDPQVPRSFKRACTWSALALSVRVGERQREQQAYMVGLPQNTMGQYPLAPRAPVSELWQLRQQREEAVTQLLSTQAALQQAMRECDTLRRRLYHAERSAQMAMMGQDMVPRAQTQQLGASMVPLNPDHARVMGAMGGYDRHYLEAQASAATNVFYMPGSTSSWPLAMQPSVPVPIPYQFPQHPQILMGSPFMVPFSPPVVMETEGVVVPVQMPPVYQSSPFAAPCSQDPAGLRDQRSYMATEAPPVIQRSFPPGNIRDFRQEGRPEKTQGIDTRGDNRSHIQGQGPRRTQERAALVDTGNDNEKKEENGKKEENREKEVTPAVPAEVAAAAAASDGAEEKGEEKTAVAAAAAAAAAYSNTVDSLQSLQDLHLPEEGELHSQSEKCPQATPLPPLGSRRSQIKKGVREVQPTHVWESWSQVVRDSPKKQQPQLRKKDRKPQMGAASESQPASASRSGQGLKL
ncbi:testis-expressed protein 13D-like [Peromyscus maniculatus bairdii]|uniref:testis-expressed protein 13D-like n=1 Tax=Peromyscus maniculatus bairdii TaxID=230844 RepID=UPI001C2E4BFC|nr:testis-expressed protein 13D-like [Peromyscus maniculatus bairdii]